ncbi:carbohydrate kinase family protein [Pararhizobium mangrovi]
MTDPTRPCLLAIGGAHVDYRGTVAGATRPGASNPGTWRAEAGGGVLNAASSLARLGHSVRLVAPRGGDPAGEIVAEAAAAAGILDTPLTFLDRATPTYTAILGADGDLVVGLADMALYDRFGPKQIMRRDLRDAIAAAPAVVTDANLPGETLKALAAACAGADVPLFAIAISPAKVVRLRPVLGSLSGLFMNAAEARTLGDTGQTAPGALARILSEKGLARGVITFGSEGACAFDGGGCWHVPPAPLDRVADVTGAGDALAAGFVHATLAGSSTAEALRFGTAAAAFAVSSHAAAPTTIDRMALEGADDAVPPAERLF